jgi:hypothetical protein
VYDMGGGSVYIIFGLVILEVFREFVWLNLSFSSCCWMLRYRVGDVQRTPLANKAAQ